MNPKLPHDIHGLMAYPASLLWLLGVLAGLLLLLGLGLWWWRRGKKEKSKATVVEDPWKVLQTRLQGLAPAEPFVPPAQKDFYFGLSMLLREVVERRTGVRATDMTLAELRRPLKEKVPLPAGEQDQLLEFLERADLVKFADRSARLEQAQDDVHQARSWFEKLRPLSIHVDASLWEGERS